MADFDAAAAKAAGYSDAEIADYLQQNGHSISPQNATVMSHSTPQAPTGYIKPWLDPTDGMSTFDKTAAGAGRGIVHTGRSLANLVGAVPDSTVKEANALDAPLMNTRAGKVGNLIGESAITAPLGMGAVGALGKAGVMGARLAANPIASSAIEGATQGLTTSDPGDRGFNAAIGGLTGGTLGAGSAIKNKLINGLSRTPEAAYLVNKGIPLTPGQLNPSGFMNAFEEASEHIMGVGGLVKGARDSAEHRTQALAIQQGAAPGTTIAPSNNLHDMLSQAQASYAPLYDQAKGFPVTPQIFRTQGANVPLDQTFAAASKAPGVPKSIQKSENEWLQDRLTQLPASPKSEDLLDLRSAIRQRGREANLRTDLNAGHVANINGRAERGVTAALESQLPPDALGALRTADSNYGNYKIVEDAIAKSKDNIAGLTPQKLSQAVYNATPDTIYAKGGGGPLRDIAQNASNVFQNVSPPNGSRAFATALAGGAGYGAYLHPALGIPVLGGAAGLTLTDTGRRLASGMTAPQIAAQKLTAALQRKAPNATAATKDLLSSTATRALAPATQASLPNALAAALMLAPPAAAVSH